MSIKCRTILNEDEQRQLRKQYYEENKEYILRRQKELYHSNKDKWKPKYERKGRNLNPVYEKPFKSSGFVLKETPDDAILPKRGEEKL